eukprot:CAMPEP_0113596120 /NCGR_PEP_ID=MMETSP0015_2-20120614/40135_1 /TAXON_ID=2838 /ORGANISM="Odontella" /LENGTH=46 /DNA_ID=CAMNT_0000503551 /DNA_START=107 /DNA_END=247 /DNA_ORIENTATION=+ /assembly_acc=CAM_ASM_000160
MDGFCQISDIRFIGRLSEMGGSRDYYSDAVARLNDAFGRTWSRSWS